MALSNISPWGSRFINPALEPTKRYVLQNDVSLECVDEFCFLHNMLGAGRGAGEAARLRPRSSVLEEFQSFSSANDVQDHCFYWSEGI
jgi:hypothetical protein